MIASITSCTNTSNPSVMVGAGLLAKNAVERGWAYAYRDRRNRKRDFRRLWITRINAAARQHELTYSSFMNGLRTAGVELNRKTLADLAVRDPNVFSDLAAVAKEALAR